MKVQLTIELEKRLVVKEVEIGPGKEAVKELIRDIFINGLENPTGVGDYDFYPPTSIKKITARYQGFTKYETRRTT